MIELEERLADLGDELDLEHGGLVDAVMARLDEADGSRGRHRVWLAAAAAALIVVGALVVVPASRQAIADWFGFDAVDIQRDPDLSVPATAPDVVTGESDDPGRDPSDRVIEVQGTLVVLGEFDIGSAELDEALVSKRLAAETGVEWVTVGDNQGLWIAGEPHMVTYRSPDGEVVSERVAGNTLLWQDGDTIHRVEGFATLPDALAFATDDRRRR